MSTVNTGTRLGAALLGYMLAVTLIVTLLPFRFGPPGAWRVMFTGNVTDLVANILLFVPLGFLYRFARPPARRGLAFSVLLTGALLSLAIEAAQLFLSARDASALDVIANALGAWLGAFAFDRIARYGNVNGRLLGWLALELPIMGLIYLLVPLLWVSSLASAGDALRHAAVILLGIVGAVLLGGVQRYYVAGRATPAAQKAAAFATLWFLAGSFPLLRTKPLYVAMGALLVGLLCWRIAAGRGRTEIPERRFEVPLLKAAAPVFAAYLLLVVIAPVYGDPGTWRLWLGFPGAASRRIEIVRLLELLAAFTLVGYMAAEFRGRAVLYFRNVVPYVLGWGAALVVLAEAVRGFHGASGASLARAALLVLATLYGGWLYYLQREHAVRLLRGPDTVR